MVVTLAVSLVIAGCGDGELTPEQQVRKSAERFLTGWTEGDADAYCGAFVAVTDGLQFYDEQELSQAIAGTERSCTRQFARGAARHPGKLPLSFKLGKITVKGERATVETTIQFRGKQRPERFPFKEVTDGNWRVVIVES